MKNPLYVVTNNGKDVEEVGNIFEAIVKKLGLEPVIALFQTLIDELLKNINSYAMLLAVQEFIDKLLESMKEVVSKAPFLARFV
ncbi:hypothetical protein M899_1957 [Bacteriovorax sp. BSW11_IV]|uniref:hypothetical protein n=1 Tax=Bacteriovorax sp. BSW11_IV TaxID=1353529 RepID=UPI00038A2F75|nr:hypothetical protein [Bacteriovorax sp. BSW11_IV]EQC48471.1 hypothetical protein M899_1957 [Bacteriovorax sp. BSW11_IV]